MIRQGVAPGKFRTLCFAYMLLLGAYLSFFQSIIYEMSGSRETDTVWISVWIALFFGGFILAPILAGEIGDRIGKKPVLQLASVLMSAGILLIAFSGHRIVVCAGILLTGVSFSTLEGLLSSQITDYFPDDAERFMNYSQGFFCFGAAIGPTLALLINRLGGSWRSGMIIGACLFILAFLALFKLPNDREAWPQTNGRREKVPTYSFTLISDRRMILLFAAMMLYVGVEEGTAFFINRYFVDIGAVSYSEINLSLYWAGMIFGRFISGKLYKHFDTIILVCLPLTICASLLLQLNVSAAVYFVLFYLTGLGMSVIWPVLMSVCTRTFKRCSGTAGGMMMTGGALGGMLVPALIGVVSEGRGVRAAFLIVPAAMTMVLVLWLLVRRNALYQL